MKEGGQDLPSKHKHTKFEVVILSDNVESTARDEIKQAYS